MHFLKPVFVAFEVVLLFNLLIFVHELGHFLAARWRGLKVERFAIWFGKPIWKAKFKGVEYVLGSIPAGGYVSLPQMAPMDMIEGKSENQEKPAEPLPSISALDKIIVAFAGPLFSFGLAVAFAVVVWVVGRPVADVENTTTVGFVIPGGPADKAGVLPGDDIQSIDGHAVTKFAGFGPSVTWWIVRGDAPTVSTVVKRGDEVKSFEITPSHEATKAWQRKSFRKIQIVPAQALLIDTFYTNSPAEMAGLKKGDEILEMDGKKMYCPLQLEDSIEKNGTKPVTLLVKRGIVNTTFTIKPEIPIASTNLANIGIEMWTVNTRIVHTEPATQVVDGLNMMTSTFGALFDRKSEIKPQHLGGAVKILSVYYSLFLDEDGWRLAFWFSVVMNINLALLNLLPLPVLDGGHILLALLEAVRRRPVSARILGYIQTACAVLLIGYMLYIAFFDVQDLFPRQGGDAPGGLKFAPKTESVK